MNQNQLEQMLTEACKKDISSCTDKELYTGLLCLVNKLSKGRESARRKKKLYYISAEFLIGKLLSNNMINLGIYSQVKSILASRGKDLSVLEELEPEPSLGNGGLGRLAACFLDSIATLGLNGDGIGLNYHFGLFRQLFRDNLQNEEPNPWMENTSWLSKTNVTYQIPYRNFTLTSRMYDIEVTGYDNRTNKLHLFDVETVDESIVEDGISFDKTDIRKNLTLFLYPDDSDRAGQILRIYQQYFMVSNAARLILSEAAAKGSTLYDLPDYAAIQINDTHPTMVIPELIRLLTTEHGMEMDDAIQVVTDTCAYTNHTILAEALETWPMDYFKEAVPQLIPIMEVLDDKVRRKFDDPSVYIIDKGDRVHMAHIDIHYGFSVNGVAALHTDILKKNELNNFYRLYPEKFNNKTNGITFRRWLLHCNPQLADYISELIGDGFKKDAFELKKLDDRAFTANIKTLHRLLAIKDSKKQELADYLKETQDIDIDPKSIFDIQVKRLHEYKRQQMNALYLIHKYLEIKRGSRPATPITAIFGAKAAPAYTIAKDIIHMILCLRQVIDSDPDVKPWLNVVMVNNYNVSLAEKLIPACDISEQISLASKEASGTSNMKFMLNGAVTLGTYDGANIEIVEQAGEDNNYIFGARIEEIEKIRESYDPVKLYQSNPRLRRAVDSLVDGTFSDGGTGMFRELYDALLKGASWHQPDHYFLLKDFDSYQETRLRANREYQNPELFYRKCYLNMANAGKFSSDRTIRQYYEEIWSNR